MSRRVATAEPMANIYISLNYDLVFSTENREASLFESVSHLDKWVRRERNEQPSALAGGEHSPAIHRRVSVKNEHLVAERRLNRTASHRMRRTICSVEFRRRDATRFASDVFKPALKRGPMFDCRYRGRSGSGA